MEYFENVRKRLSLTLRKQITKAIVENAPRIPRHIAFIMDGNRRFARKKGLDVIKGHMAGFSTLESILETCLDFNLKSVTIFAFSIENFKRSPEEVDNLMNLFKRKLIELSRERYEKSTFKEFTN